MFQIAQAHGAPEGEEFPGLDWQGWEEVAAELNIAGTDAPVFRWVLRTLPAALDTSCAACWPQRKHPSHSSFTCLWDSSMPAARDSSRGAPPCGTHVDPAALLRRRARQAVKIAVAADAANLSGERVKFGAVEQRLVDILSGRASLSQVPDTVRPGRCWLVGG